MIKLDQIAIISDIHGNLPALEAVLEDIKDKGISQIICLGDMIGKGPHSMEVLEQCLDHCHVIIKGNWEEFISDPQTKETDFIKFYRDQLGDHYLSLIRNLPGVTGFWLSGKCIRLFHANPHSVFRRVYQTSPLSERLALFEVPQLPSTEALTLKSDVVGYGDIHEGYLQHIDQGRMIFNVGSVGNSCDFIPMAAYVILEGKLHSQEEADFSIQFCRVKYDREKAISQALASKMPDQEAYINEIKTGCYSR